MKPEGKNDSLLAHQILEKYWGYKQFRPLQEDIVLSIYGKTDTIALLPTGGGKSICFQVPALMQKGICLVISPLIALMKDQVDALNKRNIKSFYINSELSYSQTQDIYDYCAFGDVKFLYVSPERLFNSTFKTRIQKMNVSMIAVDEAHCISQWGYDFRPSYLAIGECRELLPGVPILALTATATTPVIQDIGEKLRLEKPAVFKKSFTRSNLVYKVLERENKFEIIIKTARALPSTGIVYVRNRKKTKEIAQYLRENGISAKAYHAGMSFEERNQAQSEWINNHVKVMVATNAFGMGIDKPDVRWVIHIDVPDSLEAYFQEAGRAGRDEQKAYAVLLFDKQDIEQAENNFLQSFPAVETIKSIYQKVYAYYGLGYDEGMLSAFPFDLQVFAKKSDYFPMIVYNALLHLQNEGVLELSEGIMHPSKIRILESPHYVREINNDFHPLKMIVRAYTGVFDQEVNIDEFALARACKWSVDQLKQSFRNMHDQSIIMYHPSSDQPQITFLRNRLPPGSFDIDLKMYHQRKALTEKRMKAMLQYVNEKKLCRNLVMLHYFDENSNATCGQCDICEKNAVVKSAAFKQIIEILSKEKNKQYHPSVLPGILLKIGVAANDAKTYVRIMIDENFLLVMPDGSLQINL